MAKTETYIHQDERVGRLLEKYFALLFIPSCVMDEALEPLFFSTAAENLLEREAGAPRTAPALFGPARDFLRAAEQRDLEALHALYDRRLVFVRPDLVTVVDASTRRVLLYGTDGGTMACAGAAGAPAGQRPQGALRFAAWADLGQYDFSASPPLSLYRLLQHLGRHPHANLVILDSKRYCYLDPQVSWNYFQRAVPPERLLGAPMYQFLRGEDVGRHHRTLEELPADSLTDRALLWRQKRSGDREAWIRSWPNILKIHGERVNFSMIQDISPSAAREQGETDFASLAPATREKLEQFMAVSTPMAYVARQLRKAAASLVPVCIMGETGTGKTLAASLIHEMSSVREGPFIAVNCGAIPEPLFESALFGHVRGAFTGAMQNRKGAMALAARGTLLLDEVGELPLPCQAKLLQALSEHKFSPLGSDAVIDCQFRLMVATNRHLSALVEAGTFREDLYYRINVFELGIPPLRDRLEDLTSLVQSLSRAHGLQLEFSGKDLGLLMRHHWPGNVRELENVLLRCAAEGSLDFFHPAEPEGGMAKHLKERLKMAERHILLDALEKHRWNRTMTASELGISRITLFRKMRAFGL